MILTEVPLPSSVLMMQFSFAKKYLSDTGLSIIQTREPVGEDKILLPVSLHRWHISVSKKNRIPYWKELGQVKDRLLPDVFMCIPHPPREHWVNINPFVLHLIELRDQAFIDHMVWEAREITKRFGKQTPS